MKHFQKLGTFEVGGVARELERHPELWDEHPERKVNGSPHVGVPDIWVRYKARGLLTKTEDFTGIHVPVFYPAWDLLPSLHPIVFRLMAITKAVQLGGILITKVPAGGEVKPHHDRGTWHAEFFNTKVYVAVKANAGCVNYCGDEARTIHLGEAVAFDNQIVHSVVNRGDSDRITAIVCMRVET